MRERIAVSVYYAWLSLEAFNDIVAAVWVMYCWMVGRVRVNDELGQLWKEVVIFCYTEENWYVGQCLWY
jgi:hypothetical protein